MTSTPEHDQAEQRDASTEALRVEIGRTRQRLGETVEALGAQLNPSHLTQRVKDSVREATIGRVQHMATNTRERITETGRDLAQVVRDNPLPAAMAAAGIGWLILSSRSRSDRMPASTYGNGDVDDLTVQDEMYQPGSAMTEAEGGVRAGARQVADAVTQRAHDLTERAQETTQRVVARARETSHRVAERADVAMHRVADSARSTARRVEHKYEESPMAVGAVALAMGLAIGLSVPGTRREAALMGDARDKLLDKTRERVADTTEKVEHVVERAMPEVRNVIREAARDEGLTS